ncbi:MAG TPA: HAMP domain-containing protein, partial [Chloroflexota bacterium]|nr:HAMP domain-containing protein [Chloroflexota bacterium]
MGRFRNFEAAVFRRIHRDPPSGFIHRTAFWLFLAYFALALLGWIPGDTGVGFRELAGLDFFLLIILCIPLLWRYIFNRLLWKVRNRLIVTYLLMGLAPVVLLATLALLLLYVFSGQFAIFAATSVVNDELTHIGSENGNIAMHLAHVLDANPKLQMVPLPEMSATPRQHEYTGLSVAAFHDGKRVHLTPQSVDAQDAPPIPSWLPDRWHGIALDGGHLWLRAADREQIGGHTTVVISSVPIQKENVEAIAEGLGIVGVYTGAEKSQGAPKSGFNVQSSSSNQGTGLQLNGQDVDEAHRITGGALPDKEHFYDFPVRFAAPLAVTDWTGSSGKPQQDIAAAWVTSRPSKLYRRLFITSLQLGDFIRDALIAIAIAFGVLELLAFLAAVRLNRTITRSVHDLYEATLAIDGGNLSHRIRVRRKDQLGALGRSFNSMTASLERLLVEQREKERLQNELAIAQEVQANLFPRSRIALPMLEIHGVCIPARTVSGDYYDFLTFGDTGLG